MAEKVITLRSRPDAREGSYRINYAELLNPAQLEAVTHREGPLLVVAGAGSGKTRTLIYRVARLVEGRVPPQAILLLTFTRRAAQEMLRRAEQLVGEQSRAVAGGTFHSFANSVLRRHGSAIELQPNFTILDRSDMEDVINLIRTRMGLAAKERRFPRKKGTLAEIISWREQSAALGGGARRGLRLPVETAARSCSVWPQPTTAYKRERGLLDYDDLSYRTVELMEQQEGIRRQLSNTYRYVMVDEYQDTNAIQAKLVRLLAATHDNVMAVGDDAQSIYSFRGANFRNIMDFPQLFPGAR